MIARLVAFLLSHRIAVGVSVLLVACGGVTMAGVHRYRDAQRERGRAEVRAQQLDSLLTVARAESAKRDTIYQTKRLAYTRTVTQWKTDTIRERILALPDTTCVPLPAYRRLSDALDSVTVTADAALSAADSLLRAEKLRAALLETRLTNTVPTIVAPRPDKWQRRGERALILALASVVIYQQVKQ